MAKRRPVPEGIRITKVGVWYIGLTLFVGVAAANTGNNALYLVEVVLLGLFVASGVFSRRNLRYLGARLDTSGEVFAGASFYLSVEVENRDRWFAKSLLLASAELAAEPVLVERLPRRGSWRGRLTATAPPRGVHRVRWLHLWSIYPLGFMRKGVRCPVELEILVFPNLLTGDEALRELRGDGGEEAANRRGWGHELFALRAFRPGDDPRSIHWKQTARTGEFVFTEREIEEGQRLSIVFDNAVGVPRSEVEKQSFERLVSETATVVDRYSRAGFELELVTRGSTVPFGRGSGHRFRMMELLALVEALPADRSLLAPSDPRASRLTIAHQERIAV